MNNRKIINMITKLQDLDSYSQLSVLGSWNFIINSAVISEAQRYVPELPEEASGIDIYTDYEAMKRKLIKEADASFLPGLINLKLEIESAILNADGQPRSLDNTLEFLTERSPTRAQFDQEYEMRRRQGMRPQMPKKVFIDYEFERAMNQHNLLVAKGEHAILLCENITLADGELPDWIDESFESKMIEKLHSRWEKLEFVRTNPRRKKAIRDSAQADQQMISLLLKQYGETPGFNGDFDEDEDEPVEQTTEAPDKVKIWSKDEIKRINALLAAEAQ